MKKTISSLVITLVFGSLTLAQGGYDNRYGPVMRYDRSGAQCDLLVRADVQADLNLSDAARDTIRTASERRHAAMDVARTENAGDEPATERAFNKITDDYDGKVWHALSRTQRRRALAIFMQMCKGLALEDPEIQGMLNLSQLQKDKIAQIARSNRVAYDSLLAKVNNGQIDNAQLIDQRRKENEMTQANLMVVLLDDQKSKRAELCGKTFVPDPLIDDRTGRRVGENH
jgi:hypothetical protein